MSSDGGDVDEDPVAGVEVELGRAVHHQPGHARGKEQPCLDLGRATSEVNVPYSQSLVEEPDGERPHHPEPRLRGVQDDQGEVEPVEQVAEIEDLEETSATDERKRADKDDGHDRHESNSSGIGKALDEAE